MIKFRDPKLALRETVAKFGREKPVSRYAPIMTIRVRRIADASYLYMKITERDRPILDLASVCCWHLLRRR